MSAGKILALCILSCIANGVAIKRENMRFEDERMRVWEREVENDPLALNDVLNDEVEEAEGLREQDVRNYFAVPDTFWKQPLMHFRFTFHVSRASNKVVSSVLDSKPVSQTVPRHIVDKVIQRDFENDALFQSIYIIDIPLTRNLSYAYEFLPTMSKDSRTPCRGGAFVSSKRYAWLDLGADLYSLGRPDSPEYVTPAALPRLSDKLFDQAPLRRQYAAEIASLASKAAQQLMASPLGQRAIHKWVAIELQVTHIHESSDLNDRSNLGGALMGLAKLLEDRQSLYPIQSISVTEGSLDIKNCVTCLIAIRESLMPSERQVGPESKDKVQAPVEAELSPLLEDYLRQNLANLTSTVRYNLFGELSPARHSQEFGEASTFKLSIVVLDVDHDRPLLFSNSKRVISFPDNGLIIGIRNGRDTAQKRHICNGQAADLNLNAISRELSGHVLASLWGLGDVSTSVWNQGKESFDDNLLWGTGNSLFGPYAVEPMRDSDEFSSTSFPFYQADLVAVAPVYGKILDMMKGMQSAIARGLKTNMAQSRELSYRFGVFQYKIERALDYITTHAYNISWWYAKSAAHDVKAVETLIEEREKDYEMRIQCNRHPQSPWLVAVGISTLIVAAFLYLWNSKSLKVLLKPKSKFI